MSLARCLAARLFLVWMLIYPWASSAGQARAASPDALYPIDRPYGAVIALAQHPTRPEQLWAIAAAATPARLVTALYRSQNYGATWSPAGNDLSWVDLTCLAISRQGVLFLGASDGLYRRVPGDNVWRWLPLDPIPPGATPADIANSALTVRQIVLVDDDANRLLVVAAERGQSPRYWLYRSQDGGSTFARSLLQDFGAPAGASLGRLLNDPKEADRLYMATWGGVLVSADGGASWLPGGLDPSLAQSVTTLTLADDARRTLYAVRTVQDDKGTHLALAQSRDQGQTWSESAVDLPGDLRPVDLRWLPDGRLLLATTMGLFVSEGNHRSWASVSGGLGELGIYQIEPDRTRPGAWWAATPLGVYYRATEGAAWTARSVGLPVNGRVQALHVLADAPDVWLAASGWSVVNGLAAPSLLRSTDGGKTWQAIAGWRGLRINQLAEDPGRRGRLYAATARGVCISDDRGLTWPVCRLTDQVVQVVRVGANGNVYAGAYNNGLFLSQDGGDTWQSIGPPSLSIYDILLRGDRVYLCAQGNIPGIYRTDDEGVTWRLLPALPVSPAEIIQLEGSGDRLIAAAAGQGLWLSDDDGLTWTPAPGLPSDATFSLVWSDPRAPERLLAARDDAGLWQSEDGGDSWQPAYITLGDNRVTAIAADVGGGGVWPVIVATATAGIWATGRGGRAGAPLSAVDARIEVLWPHGWLPITEATRANLSLRLFRPNSLEPPPCNWRPRVQLWEARDNEPARLLAFAQPRRHGDAYAALWDVNEIDISHAQRPDARLYYMVRVEGMPTRSTVWTHGADPRTYYPLPVWPQAAAKTMPAQIDARISVVWPHDVAGRLQIVEEADLANVRVALYQSGSLISVPPAKDLTVRLMGSLDNGVGQDLGIGVMRVISATSFTYPVWDFDNIDVSASRTARSHWTFWVEVEGHATASNVWVHGLDARTYLPQVDEPIMGCRP